MKIPKSLEAAELLQLLSFARDLLQTHRVGDAISLLGKTLSGMMSLDGAMLLLKSNRDERAFAFDAAGQLKPVDKAGPIYVHSQRAMRGDISTTYLEKNDATYLVASFPENKPSGSILVYWKHAVAPPALSHHSIVLRHLAGLIGAGLGNLSLTGSLEQVVDNQSRQIARDRQVHANELLRRDHVEDEMRSLAMTDVMTGLRNRRGFFLQAEQAYQGAKRHQAKCAVIFADVDFLKQVNDQHGHEAGDQLILDCARIFLDSFRTADVVARLGGDEFVAFTMYDEKPEVILGRIQKKLETFRHNEIRPYKVSFSTGIVQCDPASSLEISDYLIIADKAMYGQKAKPPN